MVGNECLDWTSFGNEMQLVGAGLSVLLVWCFEMLHFQPSFIVQECTPRFKPFILEHIFCRLSGGRYVLQVRNFSPVDLGFPASRPRQYCILTHTQHLKVLLPFADVAVEHIFFRRLQVDATVYFRDVGGPNERQAFRRFLMRERGMAFVDKQKVVKCKTFKLLPPSKVVRFRGYMQLAAKQGVTAGVVDVNQTVGFSRRISPVIPTLLRSSMLAEISTGEVLLPSAQFDVMGIPLHRPPGVEYRPPIASLLPTMGHRDMMRLTGNAMHAAAIGMCLLYVLGCCEYISGA